MAMNQTRTADHPALAQIRGYWEGLRARGALPARSEIDPRGIERALEHAFIAERVAPGVARLRLAGMHLNDLMGLEVRGMPLTVFFEPVARDAVARLVELAFSGEAPVEIAMESGRGIGRPGLDAKMLLLPLRNEAGEIARVLGGFAATGEIGRAPRRFRLGGAGAVAGPLDTAIEQGLYKPAAPAGFAEPPKDFAAGAPPAQGEPVRRARGHLRLVHSAD